MPTAQTNHWWLCALRIIYIARVFKSVNLRSRSFGFKTLLYHCLICVSEENSFSSLGLILLLFKLADWGCLKSSMGSVQEDCLALDQTCRKCSGNASSWYYSSLSSLSIKQDESPLPCPPQRPIGKLIRGWLWHHFAVSKHDALAFSVRDSGWPTGKIMIHMSAVQSQ